MAHTFLRVASRVIHAIVLTLHLAALSTQRSWASSTNTRINLNIVPRDCSTRGSYFDFENEDEYIYEQSPPKRQRSSDGFMDKFVSRFPSLNKKTRDRKRPFTFASNSSSSSGSPYVGLSRSSSVTRSIFRRSASTEVDLDMPRSARVSCQIEPIAEMDDHEKMDLTQPDHIDENNFNRSDVETPTRVLTPLLPSVSGESDSRKSFQSPLQSPTVARYSDCGSSSQFSDFTNDTFAPGPTIVNRHLITSSPVAHSNTLSTSEVPTMLITDANDKWAGKLGHADFNIEPSPYMPAQCDRQSCQQLQANWQLARTEFTRHLARTNTHYGPSSKTYKLTEEKWNEIDAQWRQNYEQSMTQATENGSLPATDTPMEPVPIAKMLNDPWSEAKFPQRGDDVLVGPMEQAAPVQLARKPSKRRQFVQMLRMKR